MGLWTFVSSLPSIHHLNVEILEYGPKWNSDQPSDTGIQRAMLLAELRNVKLSWTCISDGSPITFKFTFTDTTILPFYSQKKQLQLKADLIFLSSSSSSTQRSAHADPGLERILRKTLTLQALPAGLHFQSCLSDRMLNWISVVLFKRVRHPICVTEKLSWSLLSTSVETHVSPYYVIKARQRAKAFIT